MTLKEAEKISNYVTDIFAQKPRNEFLRESQLRGYSFPDIHHAYALVIALRRQLGAYDPKLKHESQKYADLAAGLVASFPMSVMPDEGANRLAPISKNSAEHKKEFVKTVIAQGDKWHSNLAWAKLESLDSFNQFCWTLDPEDTLYWQNVYTHLELPYDADSPKGMPDLTFEDNSRESWVVPKNMRQQKFNPIKIFLLIVGAIAVIWFLVNH